MSDIDVERPPKKRRFFLEESTDLPPLPSVEATDSLRERQNSPVAPAGAQNEDSNSSFDVATFEAFLGEKVNDAVLQKIQSLSGDDVERGMRVLEQVLTRVFANSAKRAFAAINIYLDGSWKDENVQLLQDAARAQTDQTPSNSSISRMDPTIGESQQLSRLARRPAAPLTERRYIGAFGAVGWATRSGTALIKHEERVNIERTKTQSFAKTAKGRKVAQAALNKRQDTIVRFTNARNEEIGRLETDTASWIAPLLDHGICEMEGFCVYAPERIRSNDSIYLQLRCYILPSVFEQRGLIKPVDDNRQIGPFEAKETQAERDLHLRQMALVKLFNEINLNPSKCNETTQKHKRQGLLQSVQVIEPPEEGTDTSEPTHNGAKGASTPSSEDEPEDGKELEQNQLDTLYRKAQTFDFNMPQLDPPSTFRMDLRKYQKQGLHWMLSKETDDKEHGRSETSMHPLWEEYQWPTEDVNGIELPSVDGQEAFYLNPYSGELSLDFPTQDQNCLGGILADEMGLGKTIEMLSLMHANRSEASFKASGDGVANVNNLPRLPRNTTQIGSAPCTTLVVAPMSLIGQWQSEAEKASKAGTLRVLMYYGSERGVNLRNICCSPNAASAPNLIITSYGTILSEFTSIASNGGLRGAHDGLFSVEYWRIILDEAHFIKNRQSKTAKACYELAAKHRWVLTGTPIVNRLEDLFSLVHFLRVEPWSNFSFWKTFITVPFESGDYMKSLDVVQTVLEPLVLRRTKDMKTPDGEALVPLPPRTIDIERVELSRNERDVYDLIFNRAKRTFTANIQAGTLMKSYTTILAQILRLRQSCCHPILTRKQDVVADEDEAAAAADAASGLADDMDLTTLIERFTADADEQDANRFGAHALQAIQNEANNECPICSEEPMIEQAVTSGCWHSACKTCLMDYVNHQKDKGELPRCFNCRETINIRDIFEVVRHDEPVPTLPFRIRKNELPEESSTDGLRSSDLNDCVPNQRVALRRISATSSAKISALLSHLKAQRRSQPTAKSIVFSQFTSFLDLIETALQSAHIPFLRFDGSISQKQRASVLARFSASSDARDRGMVLLLSLRAGGVGINLTVAERVYMMDPWWSWAVEQQAIDRVHRMGQEKSVHVVRFVVAESIEEKMLKIQERKKFIATSLGMMTEEERRVQQIEDLKELLG